MTGRPTFSGHFVALGDVANYRVGHLQARRGTALLRTQRGGCVGLGTYINMFMYMSGIFRLLVLHRLQLNLLYEMVGPLLSVYTDSAVFVQETATKTQWEGVNNSSSATRLASHFDGWLQQ